MDDYSLDATVDQLFASFRGALLAVLPWAEAIKLDHSLDVQWFAAGDGSEIESTPVLGGIKEGDVVHLNATDPGGGWDQVEVIGDGIDGQFSAKALAAGGWAWNQTGIFVGTVDVQHCVLDEAHAR